MKNLLSIVLLSLLVTIGTTSFGQAKYKLGHIDSNELMALMPEREVAQKTLEKNASELETELGVMQAEFQEKYQDYLAKMDSLSDIIKQTKEAELQDLQTRIQRFQETAQRELQKKESELIQPIIEKARNAISEVAKENGYTYVFDLGTGPILYYSDKSENLLPLVKKKLGLE